MLQEENQLHYLQSKSIHSCAEFWRNLESLEDYLENFSSRRNQRLKLLALLPCLLGLLYEPDEGAITLIRNDGKLLPDCMMSHLRREYSSQSPPLELQISYLSKISLSYCNLSYIVLLLWDWVERRTAHEENVLQIKCLLPISLWIFRSFSHR
jgi:hypothetical protein